MPGTFSQIYIQIIFAVKGRDSLIQASWEEELYKYITGIVKNKEQTILAINGMPDHIHIFIGYKPTVPIPDLVKDIKVASGLWIKENKLSKFKFNWQEGYGAFSYSQSHIDVVCKNIQNQELHHKKKTFRQEYLELLKKFQIEYQEKYLFDFFD